MKTGLPCHACGMTFTECMKLSDLNSDEDTTCCEKCDHAPSTSQEGGS